MQTREQIQELLQPLTDPESGKSLIELQLIRDIMIKEDRISLSIVCLDSDEKKRMELEQQVRDLLTAGGAEQIHIRLRDATDYERAMLRGEGSGDEPDSDEGEKLKGHAAGLEGHELINENSGVNFIAIASGKGGVGKSTVTVNLAVALARKGKRVGLIDADIYGFSIPDMMGIEEGPIVEEGTIIPVERFGVKVMSMGFFIRENSPVIWRGPMLGKMLRQFFADVGWGNSITCCWICLQVRAMWPLMSTRCCRTARRSLSLPLMLQLPLWQREQALWLCRPSMRFLASLRIWRTTNAPPAAKRIISSAEAAEPVWRKRCIQSCWPRCRWVPRTTIFPSRTSHRQYIRRIRLQEYCSQTLQTS